MEKITIADIAEVAGFSESHFMRYFKETMGTSFIDYIREYIVSLFNKIRSCPNGQLLIL